MQNIKIKKLPDDEKTKKDITIGLRNLINH